MLGDLEATRRPPRRVRYFSRYFSTRSNSIVPLTHTALIV